MKKILIAVDGSNESKRAAVEAMAIACKARSAVTFLSVVPSSFEPLVEAGIVDKKYAALPDKAMKESTETMLDIMMESLQLGDVPVSKMLVNGFTQVEIIRVAQEGSYDLIVTGYRSIDVFRNMTPGSVAKRVFEEAPCSVMIVR
jgi:nucleotide-binding universal stress UspA family protein